MATTPKTIEDINKMYDNLYTGKDTILKSDRDKAIAALVKERTSANNGYETSKRTIENKRAETKNKYINLYNDLATQLEQGKKKYYGDRDNTMYQNAKNVQAVRDYMARNNLLASGESVDALLRSNTDFSNSMGAIRGQENDFIKGNSDSRVKYQGQEITDNTGYDNSLADALSERDRLIADINSRETGYGDTYTSLLSAFKNTNDADRAKAILTYNETLRAEAEKARQEEIARKAAAEQARIEREWKATQAELDRQVQRESIYASRSSGGSSSSSGEDFYGLTKQEKNSMFNDYDTAYSQRNPLGVNDAFQYITDAYNNGQITDVEYQKYVDKNKTFKLDNFDRNFTKWSVNNDGTYNKKSYGYRNGVAGYY